MSTSEAARPSHVDNSTSTVLRQAVSALTRAVEGSSDPAKSVLMRTLRRIEDVVATDCDEAIQRGSDDLRLQTHLAVLEAREQLHIVTPQLRRALSGIDAALDRFEAAAEIGRLEATLARMDARAAWEQARRAAQQDGADLTRQARQVLQDLRVRLETFLPLSSRQPKPTEQGSRFATNGDR